MDRSKSQAISAALPSTVATDKPLFDAVEEGKQALREGRLLDHASVVAAFNRLTASVPDEHPNRDLAARMRAFRAGKTLGGLNPGALIREGRR